MIGRTYLLRGERVVVVVTWRQQPKAERMPEVPHLNLRPWTPKNVMVRLPDGSLVVRPFRGLRRIPDDQ